MLTVEGITELFTIREEIAWEAILHADDLFYRGQYIVRLLLDRSYKPMSVRPSWFWRFDRIYAQQGLKAVYIRTSGLEMNARQLVGLIRRMTAADAAERVDVLKALAGRRDKR